LQRIAIIINPTAGRGEAGRRLPEIKASLNAAVGCEVRYYQTNRAGDGERQALDAIREGANIITAVGGDGTLHEVVNALLTDPSSSAILGLIPFGTGNDFARAVGLRGSLEHMIKTLTSGASHAIDIGIISSASLEKPKHFLVAAGMGFVADTAKTVNDGVKKLTGPAAYVYGALATLKRFKPESLTLTIDGQTIFEGEVTLISVSNVETTGGGIKIAPGSSPDDGLLNICVVEKVSKSKIILMLPRAFTGDHVNHPAVTMYTGKKIEIQTANACPLWIDGEVVGSTPATFEIISGALKMMLPTPWCSTRQS
jgi:diacylglycerol kinase (ATP)